MIVIIELIDELEEQILHKKSVFILYTVRFSLILKQSKWHTYFYLNLTLFIFFDILIRQLSLLNDTKQLIANACEQENCVLKSKNNFFYLWRNFNIF